MEEMDRELIAEQRVRARWRSARAPRRRAATPRSRPRGISVAAQIGDQPAALGHGEQHRVEREQEAHERADHRKQRGRLVGGRGGLREQLFRRGSRTRRSGAPPRVARAPRAPGLRCPGAGSTRMRLRWPVSPPVPGRIRAAPIAIGLSISAPIWLFVELGVERGFAFVPRDLEASTSCQTSVTPIVLGHRRGQHDRPKTGEGRQRGAAHERAAELGEARRRRRAATDSLPLGPRRSRSLPRAAPRAARRGCGAPGRADASAKPCASRAVICRVARPTMPLLSLPTELDRLELAIWEANSSPTPAAMPDDREALLQQPRAQAHAIEMNDVRELHRRSPAGSSRRAEPAANPCSGS